MKTRGWDCEPEELEQIWDALRFRHFKWDIWHKAEQSIFPDAIVLTPAEHAELVDAAESTWAALRAVEAQVCADVERIRAVGVPPEIASALLAAPPAAPRVTRCDFHRDPDGRWWISEFNDDVPSGFLESWGLGSVLADAFPGARFAGDLRAAFIEACRPWPRVGFVCATAYSEDLQHVACLGSWLESAGHEVVHATPHALRVDDAGRAFLGSAPVDLVFRYFPGEWIGELPNADAWHRAAACVPMTNPLRALASQSKRFYAAQTELGLSLAPEHEGALQRWIPASWFLESLPRERLLAERTRWVLKGAFGRMGNTVHVGGLTPQVTWAGLVDEALATHDLVAVQERFLSHPLWFGGGLGHATVGVYLVQGRFAGYYSRIDRNPLIAYDSWHVPTLVQTD